EQQWQTDYEQAQGISADQPGAPKPQSGHQKDPDTNGLEGCALLITRPTPQGAPDCDDDPGEPGCPPTIPLRIPIVPSAAFPARTDASCGRTRLYRLKRIKTTPTARRSAAGEIRCSSSTPIGTPIAPPTKNGSSRAS